MGFLSNLKMDELFLPTLMVLVAASTLSFESVLKTYQQKFSERSDSFRSRLIEQIGARMRARRPLNFVLMLVGFVWLMQTLVQNSWAAN
jgi:hypothetical protein